MPYGYLVKWAFGVLGLGLFTFGLIGLWGSFLSEHIYLTLMFWGLVLFLGLWVHNYWLLLRRSIHSALKKFTKVPQWFRLTIPFMASCFGAILLRLYQYATAQPAPANLSNIVVWSLYAIAGLLFLLPFLHLLLSLKIENDRRLELDDRIAVTDAIFFRTRTDFVQVESQDCIILGWEMELDSESDVPHTHIEFPIYLEINTYENPHEKIESFELFVNGVDLRSRAILTYREKRIPLVQDGSPSMLAASIRIPVRLGKHEPFARVSLSVKTVRAFPNLMSPNVEYLFVEIPFLTRVLKVQIRGSEKFNNRYDLQLNPGLSNGKCVEAESYFLRSLDTEEIQRVLKEGIQEEKPEIRIEFDYPKTGYQYRFRFNACQKDATREPDEPPEHE
jgi:hypothetical protein